MSFSFHKDIPETLQEKLTLALKNQHTLSQVLQWSQEQKPPVELVEIVQQDEFTMDVVFSFEDVFLIFDTT